MCSCYLLSFSGQKRWRRDRQTEERGVVCAVTVRSGEELLSLVPLLLVFRVLQPLGCNPFLMGVDFVLYLVG